MKHYDKNKKPRWFTESTIVDMDTGEIIPQYLVDRGEYIIKTIEKQNEFNRESNTGHRKFTKLAYRNPQTTLF